MDTTARTLPTTLVPLDGSPLAEKALPIAQHLAQTMNSVLLLVRVIPVTTWVFAIPDATSPLGRYQELIDAEDHAARQYLERVADEVRCAGCRVETLALRGDPAAVILDLEPRAHVDLVVMATHGRTGLARFAIGSVADQVVRGGSVAAGRVPVLLVRPFAGACRQPSLEHALVPLDGSQLSELALDVVRQLADRVVHHVTLVRVVDASAPSEQKEEADGYLEERRRHLTDELAGRSCTIETRLVRGDPAEEIIRKSREACDLVIMATHGHTGAQRRALGSVADRALQGTDVPLLLVRPARPPQALPSVQAESGAGGPERQTGRILVVAEQATVRQSLSLALEEAGHDVRDTATADEAVAILRQSEHPLVVLLDSQCARVLALAASDRRLASHHAYVLLCADTGQPEPWSEHVLALLAMLVLRKPFGKEELLKAVSYALCMLPSAQY